MSIEIYAVAVGFLLLFAVFDLIVGVSNDAVNFLSSSIGSRVASVRVILLVASLGLLCGVLFSNGMMEVARKGIFHPQYFTMPELVSLFTAVMLADILILDLFNTYGLPTSTTVSIVFELLGAAAAIALMKVVASDGGISDIGHYINSAKTLSIVFGILLSVIVAFAAGAVVQFFARLSFTFDYQSNLSRWGGVWGGLAIASISLFIMLKGAKGAAFLSADDVAWIQTHSLSILSGTFVAAAIVFQVLCSFFQVNVLKPIVLIGTFALALAFAANDLVNFIGVPLAGLESYKAALLSADPINTSMSALQGKVHSNMVYLLVAGCIMVATLWTSRKARTVTGTSVDLSRQQEEGSERFESVALARAVVRMVAGVFEAIKFFIPRSFRKFVKRRLNPSIVSGDGASESAAPFDLVRASVNLMVASAVVSMATSMKLPLSTTYVTFMVAMGTSFADQAWGRDAAVYRVTGVLTVIGGWFVTGLLAFAVAFIFASAIFYLGPIGVAVIVVILGIVLWNTHYAHKRRALESEQEEVFNLRKITDSRDALNLTFRHTSLFLRELAEGIELAMQGIAEQNLDKLRRCNKSIRKIESWAAILTANVFKVLRLMDQAELSGRPDYGRTNRCLQKLGEAYRDLTKRTYQHFRNHHKGLLSVQLSELDAIKKVVLEIISDVEGAIGQDQVVEIKFVDEKFEKLNSLTNEFNEKQTERIRNRSSKTRLSILYYSITDDLRRAAVQSVRLLRIYVQSQEASK